VVKVVNTVVKVARSIRGWAQRTERQAGEAGGGLRGRNRLGVGNLAQFEHKRTLFNIHDRPTIFSLTSGAHATAGGSEPPLAPSL